MNCARRRRTRDCFNVGAVDVRIAVSVRPDTRTAGRTQAILVRREEPPTESGAPARALQLLGSQLMRSVTGIRTRERWRQQ